MFLLVIVKAQTPPPPPPPPSQWYMPSAEDVKRNLEDAAGTIDELLFPENQFASKDEVFHQVADSVRAKRKLKMAYMRLQRADSVVAIPLRHYTWYNKDGKVAQTAQRYAVSDDSLIHRWKYTSEGKVSTYIILEVHLDEGTLSKPSINGDSMVLKYTSTGAIKEVTRFSVMYSKGMRTASFVSKDVFVYNTNGTLLSKSMAGGKYNYFYDSNEQPVRIEFTPVNGKSVTVIDSLVWSFNEVNDTIKHWAMSKYSGVKILVDMLVVNRQTQLQLNYTLYVEDKYNYIRKVNGPISITKEYDVANRVIRKTIRKVEGDFVEQTGYEYASDGFLNTNTIFTHYDVKEGESLPTAANNYPNSLYESTKLSYVRPEPQQIPLAIDIIYSLVGVKNEMRETLATRASSLRIVIVCQYY